MLGSTEDPEEFYDWGDQEGADELKIPLAQSLTEAVSQLPFFTLEGTKRQDDLEALIIEFQVQLPQNPPVPIRNRERIAIVLGPQGKDIPKVLALRKDFPVTAHQNLTPEGEPKSLCLFEEGYEDIRPLMTPHLLLGRVSKWLARAAIEELHLPDQPLEPLLQSSNRIVFDRDIFNREQGRQPPLIIRRLSDNPLLLRAYTLPENADQFKTLKEIHHVLLPIEAPAWHSRIFSHQPLNLQQLVDLFKELNLCMEDQIRDFIHYLHTSPNWAVWKDCQVVIILKLPKTRTVGGKIESTEWWAFLVRDSVEELAVRLGSMGKADGEMGILIGTPVSSGLDTITVIPLRPTFTLSKRFARELSGLTSNDPSIVAIGAGALGSQVILNLARQGFGTWNIVDDDFLLPHNLTRHGLGFIYEGANKAEALAAEIQHLMNSESSAQGYRVNILAENLPSKLSENLDECDFILDFSTSHAVGRAIALADFPAGRMSVFLSPNGRYLVIVSEGQDRTVRLDDLEMQLAAEIAENPRLHGVYRRATGIITYAGSCRDASVQLAQDIVAAHAAAASQFIKANYAKVEPSISIWEWSDTDFSLSRCKVLTFRVSVIQNNGWTIRISDHARSLMRTHRRNRLPNETGGVLLGKIDHDCRNVYISTILPSPPDSVEWPTVYIRGVRGLRERIEEIAEVTGGDISYIGEWHSHPQGSSSDPSADDLKAHKWLEEEVGFDGLPGIIAIQGDDAQPRFII